MVKSSMILLTDLFFLILCVSVTMSKAGYKLVDEYSASNNFFDGFRFETLDDPTNGYVDYIDEETAWKEGLIAYTSNISKVYIGVDYENVIADDARGRRSVRLSSKRVLNENTLLVIDLDHLPTTLGQAGLAKGCSIWPAFWTFGPDWPNSGEIDIIEYANNKTSNYCTLHTDTGCEMTKEAQIDPLPFTGSWVTTNCDVWATANAGCSILNTPNSAGSTWNADNPNGGVYAMEWGLSEIRVFLFSRDSIPTDLLKKVPEPGGWGIPMATFYIGAESQCPSEKFKDHNIVFDITFCGDWAGVFSFDICILVFPSCTYCFDLS